MTQDNEEITFHDRTGAAVAYSDDGFDIHLFDGRAVAYFHGTSIYAHSGRHLGRMKEGWVRDNEGRCVFFTDKAWPVKGPVQPQKIARPAKGVKSVGPQKAARTEPLWWPDDVREWSDLSGERFFSEDSHGSVGGSEVDRL
jgi:hypothetical protein